VTRISSLLHRAFSDQFIRPAIRFMIAILFADWIAIGMLDDGAAAPYVSFSVVVLLYFLDFDGTPWMRVRSLGIAALVGVLCVTLGTLVAGHTWLAVAVTIPVSFAFAYSRVLKGFVARSAVGLMIAYALPVLAPAKIELLPHYIGGWLFGSVIAIIAALVILPKYAIMRTQVDIANWCRIAARMATAIARRESTAGFGPQLLDSLETLRQDTVGAVRRPGATSPKLRALLEMGWHMNAATLAARQMGPIPPDDHPGALAEANARVLNATAAIVDRTAVAREELDMNAARAADLQDCVRWTEATLRTNPTAAVEQLVHHYPTRITSMLADAMQFLGLQSRGVKSEPPDLGVIVNTGPIQLLQSNLTWRSPWFRNALRAGIGAAAAVGLANALGLVHGFWVVLATLTVMQVTFTSAKAGSAALHIALGAVAGVLAGALLLFGTSQEWIYLLALAISAALAKWSNARYTTVGQAMFTVFAIINVTLLNWPPTVFTAASRLVDLLVGLAVAVVLTLVLFPRGLQRLITSSDAAADTAVRHYAQSVRAAAAGRAHDDLDAARHHAVLTTVAFGDTIDAAFMDSRGEQQAVTIINRDEGLQHLGILAGDAMRRLIELPEGDRDPQLTAIITDSNEDRVAQVSSVIAQRPAEQLPSARELVSVTFSCWWLDFLQQAQAELSAASGRTPR